MNKENRSTLHRELFSELIESPIHPLLINMVRPYVDSCDPKFRLQINGEALWHWREVRGQPSTAFDVLQASISRLGYKLEESARDRGGHAIATNIPLQEFEIVGFNCICVNITKKLNPFERARSNPHYLYILQT